MATELEMLYQLLYLLGSDFILPDESIFSVNKNDNALRPVPCFPAGGQADVHRGRDHLFTFLMGCLLVFLFKPGGNPVVTIDRETKIFLFTFGILTFVDLYHDLF